MVIQPNNLTCSDHTALAGFCSRPPPLLCEHQQNLELVAKLESLAAKKGCTTAQLALAWLLAQAPDVIPIPGTKRIGVMEENVAAAAVVLSQQELKELEAAVPAGAVAGDR